MISLTGLLLGFGAPETRVRVSFPTPVRNPKLGTDLQDFTAQCRQDGTGSTADFHLRLFETGGTTALYTSAPIAAAADPGVVVPTFWNATALSTISGAAVEAEIVGVPRGGSWVEVGALEWNATLSTPISSGFVPSGAEEFGAAVAPQSTNTDLEVSFESLPFRLWTDRDQEIRVQVRRHGGGATDPTVTVRVYEGGVLRATPVNAQSVSSTTGAVISATWNATSLAKRSPDDITIRVTGTGVSGAAVEIGAIEWNVAYTLENVIRSGVIDGVEVYGARVFGSTIFGDPQTLTSGFIADTNTVLGATVRGPVVQSSFTHGALALGPQTIGSYSYLSLNQVHQQEVFGATLTQTANTGGRERVKPNSLLELAGLSGTIADVQDDPDVPDNSWLTTN